jgi:uncharacterized FlaG/YvyC family protein
MSQKKKIKKRHRKEMRKLRKKNKTTEEIVIPVSRIEHDIIKKSSKDDYTYTSKSIPNIDKLIDDLGVRMNFQLEEAIGQTILFNKI